MSDILNEANNILQCKECPWYKSCIIPMRFSAEEITRQMANMPGAAQQQNDLGMQSLISGWAKAAEKSLTEGCPIFVERLRQSPKLAQRIKEIMQHWSEEG